MALNNFIAASSGGAGAAFSSVVLYPLDVVKTHMNRGADSKGEKYTGPADVARRVVKAHGVKGLYAGITTRTTHQVVQKFVFYYVYDLTRSLAKTFLRVKELTFTAGVAVGWVAGVATVFIANPLEVASTRLQLQTGGSGSQPGLFGMLVKMAREEGPSVFYKGGMANMILAFNPAIENAFFDRIKGIFLRRQSVKSLSVGQAFWLGAVAKIIATALTFPFVRAKVLMQASKEGKENSQNNEANNKGNQSLVKPLSTSQVLYNIIMDDGVLALWKGMGPQTLKSVLSSAVLLAAKEKIELIVKAAILAAIAKR
eukprot:TRINITY_DN109945_c0_g1_i1.p1 TRINITY_DN109945_c0_g1~~TRINITY_DN109945_c0_g1_i1.p1  ORF type:complete len:313 (-),score=67.45 TRINITY_DN109945_c0_g1_i1:283-1221(-)